MFYLKLLFYLIEFTEYFKIRCRISFALKFQKFYGKLLIHVELVEKVTLHTTYIINLSSIILLRIFHSSGNLWTTSNILTSVTFLSNYNSLVNIDCGLLQTIPMLSPKCSTMRLQPRVSGATSRWLVRVAISAPEGMIQCSYMLSTMLISTMLSIM